MSHSKEAKIPASAMGNTDGRTDGGSLLEGDSEMSFSAAEPKCKGRKSPPARGDFDFDPLSQFSHPAANEISTFVFSSHCF